MALIFSCYYKSIFKEDFGFEEERNHVSKPSGTFDTSFGKIEIYPSDGNASGEYLGVSGNLYDIHWRDSQQKILVGKFRNYI